MMDWRGMVIDGFGRALEELEEALKGLTEEDLNAQPHPDCNSMGWTAWHLVRGQDAQIAALAGKDQLWISDRWYETFGRAPDGDDTGFGDTPEEVRAFQSPPADTILAYFKAALEQTRVYIGKLSEAELDRELDEPWFQPQPTVAVRVVSIMADCLVHAGEIDYLRGLLTAMGKVGKRPE